MKAMARQQRSHSIEFKRQVVQEYMAGETLYGLAKRHDLSRQLIRVWVEKYEAGGLDADAQAADGVGAHGWPPGSGNRIFKGGAEKRTAAAKRDYIRHCRPDGVSIAEGGRLMEIARSTFYDRPDTGTEEAAVV